VFKRQLVIEIIQQNKILEKLFFLLNVWRNNDLADDVIDIIYL